MTADERKGPGRRVSDRRFFNKTDVAIGLFVALVLLSCACFVFSGCGISTYQGKAVPRQDAENMKKMGMEVRPK